MVDIYTYKPTKEEIYSIVGESCTLAEIPSLNKNTQLSIVGQLLWMRGKEKEAKKIIEQIDDEMYKLDIYRLLEHP